MRPWDIEQELADKAHLEDAETQEEYRSGETATQLSGDKSETEDKEMQGEQSSGDKQTLETWRPRLGTRKYKTVTEGKTDLGDKETPGEQHLDTEASGSSRLQEHQRPRK